MDDLELLRRRSNPDERISERNLSIASKFMDGIKSDELKTKLATHFTLSLHQVPTPDDLRMKSREYLLIKPRAQNRYSNYGNYGGRNTGANSSWYRPRDDMDKRGHVQIVARWRTQNIPVMKRRFQASKPVEHV